ncbi:helix-turn-helix domain-containing protein [Cytobacillus firmus]|uniref:helix-turn-helix domain-containing protein n=1 Tax=Cytobacillus firmus TaxID=1399 RepID=UPI0018CD6D48|nr:LexA family transcriptional regulator [Cytobacillus firmus]MED1906154.1 S24 family peptidase [Cytobacillus firmus]MED1941569.1 S24 family peptidase [Cytobacillus firmus]
MNEIEFGQYLKSLRKEKKLTIRQLESLSGVSNAYLSQLENGKRGIPSPEILKKIHHHLDVDFDEIMLKAGHISDETKDKLTPEALQLINRYDLFSELIENVEDYFKNSITNENGILKKEHRDLFIESIVNDNKEMTEGLAKQIVEDPDFVDKLFSNLTLNEKIYFLNIIIKDFVERNIDPNTVFTKTPSKDKDLISILKVPVLGYIAAGQPILAEEHIEEWTEVPNMWNLKIGEVIVLKVKGDSMIGSRIYEGDRVVVKLQPDVENGEIAVVNVDGDAATLKRVKKTENGQVILYPDNPRYEPTFINNENARIIGKVIQVMFEPK